TLLASLALLLAVAVPAVADNGDATPPREIAKETVQTLMEGMEGRRDELRNDPQQLYELVDEVLVPLVDMDTMSQLVLGRHWRDADENQRQRFQKAFKVMLVRTYGNALLDFDKDQIEYKPIREPDDADDITFRATVTTDSGDKVPVNLKMHLVDNEWKVYDGRVGNMSFVTNYRSQFNNYIRKNGLEDFLDRMEARYDVNG